MVQILKAQVVNPKLKLVSMLHNVEHVLVDLEGVLERCSKLLYLIDAPAISIDLFLAAEVAAHELDSHDGRVKTESPTENRF